MCFSYDCTPFQPTARIEETTEKTIPRVRNRDFGTFITDPSKVGSVDTYLQSTLTQPEHTLKSGRHACTSVPKFGPLVCGTMNHPA